MKTALIPVTMISRYGVPKAYVNQDTVSLHYFDKSNVAKDAVYEVTAFDCATASNCSSTARTVLTDQSAADNELPIPANLIPAWKDNADFNSQPYTLLRSRQTGPDSRLAGKATSGNDDVYVGPRLPALSAERFSLAGSDGTTNNGRIILPTNDFYQNGDACTDTVTSNCVYLQYATNSNGPWVDADDLNGVWDNLAPGQYYVRSAYRVDPSTDNHYLLPSQPTSLSVREYNTAFQAIDSLIPNTPSAAITGFETDQSYTITGVNSGATYTVSGVRTFYGLLPGIYDVSRMPINGQAVANPTRVTVGGNTETQTAPVGLSSVWASSATAADGFITGLRANRAYEYRLKGENTWITLPIGTRSISQLVAGDYEVRYAATATASASPARIVTIGNAGPDAEESSTTPNNPG
ncbi:MAG: hypothetical protein Q3972_09035, partial [Corynebacterium sp.]|nr:hypothetical protein [Corynebacterium sp.]